MDGINNRPAGPPSVAVAMQRAGTRYTYVDRTASQLGGAPTSRC
jgi:hypothetical protein